MALDGLALGGLGLLLKVQRLRDLAARVALRCVPFLPLLAVLIRSERLGPLVHFRFLGRRGVGALGRATFLLDKVGWLLVRELKVMLIVF